MCFYSWWKLSAGGDFTVIIIITLCSCDELDVLCGWTFECDLFYFFMLLGVAFKVYCGALLHLCTFVSCMSPCTVLQPQLLTWGGRMWPPEHLTLSEQNTHIQCCCSFCSLRFLWGQIMDTRSACSHIYTSTAEKTLPPSKSGTVNNVSSTLVIILP